MAEPLRTVEAIRYVAPLREGGSLPGLMEADDLGTYVVKFSGAGQGRPVLVAEVVAGELARSLGLPVPELVVVEVDPELGRVEPDEEVQDLLRASPGPNLGADFLPRSLGFDPNVHRVDPALASRVLWFDAYIGNVDRSWRNPNLLLWHRQLFLIDHGACLTFAHDWRRAGGAADRPYDSSDHVLSAQATARLQAADELSAALSTDLLVSALARVPDAWLSDVAEFEHPGQVRAAYVDHLQRRLAARDRWQP